MTQFDMTTPHTLTLTGHLSRADKAQSAYRLLPFDVPEGTARLEVAYRFSDDDPGKFPRPAGNILDIGLFDPRGSEFLTAQGFRGWSGSARRSFFLSASEATPGYLPGPIQAGRWEILLGPYRILPQGCEYEITIRLVPGMAPETKPPLAPDWPVLSLEPGWFRGDLHSHTHHSDARGSLADLVAAARAQGLDFLAVTDHNTTSHLAHLPAHCRDGLLLIPGLEITTEHGHANAWGIRRWHEFRCETHGQIARVVEDVRSAGALVSVNHPKLFGPPWTFGLEEVFDCIEVWQAAWPVFNDQSLALWDGLLRNGHRITAVGGSDIHQTPPGDDGLLVVGRPCTWVYARGLSVEGILAGIKAGHVFVSEGPAGPKLSLSARVGDGPPAMMGDDVCVPPGTEATFHCDVEGAEGDVLRIRSRETDTVVPLDAPYFRHEWRARVEGDGFVRVEVRQIPGDDEADVRALSNPIYLKADY